MGTKKCRNCKKDIAIRNPTGNCDHLYYPENLPKPNKKAVIKNKKGVALLKPFNLTSVCLEDLQSMGYDILNIDNTTMEELADKMGEAIMTEFWIDIEIIADHLKIPKIK